MSEDKMEKYTRLEKLGEGTYGTVFKAENKENGTLVALKQIHTQQEEEGISVTTLREISLMKNLNHKNIVKFIDVFFKPGSITFVMEYLRFDLRKYLDVQHGLEPALLKSYAFQLLCGLCYLHSNRIMHRDIKPQNMLINQEGFFKICDFGLARLFPLSPRELTPDVITIWYRPVELLLHSKQYDMSVDIWSAGCLIAEMVHGEALFKGDSLQDQLIKIFQVLGTPNDATWPEFSQMPGFLPTFPVYYPQDLGKVIGTNDPLLIDLLSKMLVENPANRISALRALSHPFFQDIPQKLIEYCLPEGVTLDH